MSRLTTHAFRPLTGRHVDSEGELYARPVIVGYVFVALVILTVLEAANEVFKIGGPRALYQTWFHDAVILAATVLILARAVYEPVARKAWLAFGLAMASWTIGSVAWTLAYGGRAVPPYPTFADGFWLLWYPLMAVGIALLIKIHLPRFEFHRWMDGVAVMLLVLAAGFAVVIQPVADRAAQGMLATVVDFSYPVLDLLLIGAILGVCGLLGWRPDALWFLLGLGVLASTGADAAFAVQEARGLADVGNYDFVWTVGAVLIAYAAWVKAPGAQTNFDVSTGLRAVALLLVAQAVAAGIQIYALFGTLGKSERVITLVVLAVTSVQIILSRPRPEAPSPRRSTSPEPLRIAPETDLDDPGEPVAGSSGGN